MDDGFNPHGSGPTPVWPRNIVELMEIVDTQLDRAERAIFFARRGDNGVTVEPFGDSRK